MTASSLETLPTETLYNIVALLVPWKVKDLSRVSKRLREACLPTLFRCVKFQFSEAGFFDELQKFTESAARYHVVSFTYEVPELLKTEILDFSSFKSDLLTPNDYVETAKELYDAGGEADECPAYMVSLYLSTSIKDIRPTSTESKTTKSRALAGSVEDQDEDCQNVGKNETAMARNWQHHWEAGENLQGISVRRIGEEL